MQKTEIHEVSFLCPDKSLKACPNYETMKKHFIRKGNWDGCAGCCAGCLKRRECDFACDAVRAALLPSVAPEVIPAARTLEQIEAEIATQLELGNQLRETYLQAFARATTPILIRIGECLKEEKDVCRREKIRFEDRIKERFGFSQRTADNYMRLANEIAPDSPIAQLPYTKALALTALPSGEREQFAADIDADNISKRQLQDAIREKQEASKRAEDAQRKAASFERALSESNDLNSKLNQELEDANRKLREEREKRQIAAEPVKVYPPDYDDLKRENAILTRRAEEAENYAAEAEEALHEAQQTAQEAQMRVLNESTVSDTPLDVIPFSDACAALLNKLFAAPYSAMFFSGKSDTELDRYACNIENVLSWATGAKDAIEQARAQRIGEGGDYFVR